MVPQIRANGFWFLLRVAFPEGYVHAIPDSSCAGTETIPRRAREGLLFPGGGGTIGMCRCEGCGFQAVYSGIGYINQSVWV